MSNNKDCDFSPGDRAYWWRGVNTPIEVTISGHPPNFGVYFIRDGSQVKEVTIGAYLYKKTQFDEDRLIDDMQQAVYDAQRNARDFEREIYKSREE